jgi:hypothetical protein
VGSFAPLRARFLRSLFFHIVSVIKGIRSAMAANPSKSDQPCSGETAQQTGALSVAVLLYTMHNAVSGIAEFPADGSAIECRRCASSSSATPLALPQTHLLPLDHRNLCG